MDVSNINYVGIETPCYVMEESKLRSNLELIKTVQDRSGVEIILALKSFAIWKSFPIFREYIQHTTASSPYEARLSLDEFGALAHTYSPAYTDSDFKDILHCSSHITFNSFSQYNRYIKTVFEYNSKEKEQVVCGLRINPEYSEIETELYNPCAPGSRFGVLSSHLPDILPDGITGFHCHNHCESSSYALEHTLQQIEKKFFKWLPQIKWLNLGGGHLITKKDYNIEHLIQLLLNFQQRYPNIHLILEPGSAFAWNTGCLVSSIVDIVENNGIKTAILDVSFTCHMPDCLEMPYQPTVVGANTLNSIFIKPFKQKETVYRLGGNSCLSGDYMGYWEFDHLLEVGEKIVFEDMIHYTIVKTNMFNGIQHPSIALLHMDGKIELYKKFRYEDYRDRMC